MGRGTQLSVLWRGVVLLCMLLSAECISISNNVTTVQPWLLAQDEQNLQGKSAVLESALQKLVDSTISGLTPQGKETWNAMLQLQGPLLRQISALTGESTQLEEAIKAVATETTTPPTESTTTPILEEQTKIAPSGLLNFAQIELRGGDIDWLSISAMILSVGALILIGFYLRRVYKASATNLKFVNQVETPPALVPLYKLQAALMARLNGEFTESELKLSVKARAVDSPMRCRELVTTFLAASRNLVINDFEANKQNILRMRSSYFQGNECVPPKERTTEGDLVALMTQFGEEYGKYKTDILRQSHHASVLSDAAIVNQDLGALKWTLISGMGLSGAIFLLSLATLMSWVKTNSKGWWFPFVVLTFNVLLRGPLEIYRARASASLVEQRLPSRANTKIGRLHKECVTSATTLDCDKCKNQLKSCIEKYANTLDYSLVSGWDYRMFMRNCRQDSVSFSHNKVIVMQNIAFHCDTVDAAEFSKDTTTMTILSMIGVVASCAIVAFVAFNAIKNYPKTKDIKSSLFTSIGSILAFIVVVFGSLLVISTYIGVNNNQTGPVTIAAVLVMLLFIILFVYDLMPLLTMWKSLDLFAPAWIVRRWDGTRKYAFVIIAILVQILVAGPSAFHIFRQIRARYKLYFWSAFWAALTFFRKSSMVDIFKSRRRRLFEINKSFFPFGTFNDYATSILPASSASWDDLKSAAKRSPITKIYKSITNKEQLAEKNPAFFLPVSAECAFEHGCETKDETGLPRGLWQMLGYCTVYQRSLGKSRYPHNSMREVQELPPLLAQYCRLNEWAFAQAAAVAITNDVSGWKTAKQLAFAPKTLAEAGRDFFLFEEFVDEKMPNARRIYDAETRMLGSSSLILSVYTRNCVLKTEVLVKKEPISTEAVQDWSDPQFIAAGLFGTPVPGLCTVEKFVRWHLKFNDHPGIYVTQMGEMILNALCVIACVAIMLGITETFPLVKRDF